MDLKLRTRSTGDATVVEVSGEVELHSAEQLRDALMQASNVERPCIVVDLSRVSFIDSSGLGVLVGALKRVRERGALSLVCPQARVRRVFEITGLTQVFSIYNQLEDAVAVCSTAPGAARAPVSPKSSSGGDAASGSGASTPGNGHSMGNAARSHTTNPGDHDG
jgi:anti-sigma B factor antagonist